LALVHILMYDKWIPLNVVALKTIADKVTVAKRYDTESKNSQKVSALVSHIARC